MTNPRSLSRSRTAPTSETAEENDPYAWKHERLGFPPERSRAGGRGAEAGHTHLLLVLVLEPQPVLDAGAGLQEGPPLGALGQEPHEHPVHVHAHEEQGVGTKLEGRGHGRWAGAPEPLRQAAGPRWLFPACVPVTAEMQGSCVQLDRLFQQVPGLLLLD